MFYVFVCVCLCVCCCSYYAKIVIYVNFVWDTLLSCVEFIGEPVPRRRHIAFVVSVCCFFIRSHHHIGTVVCVFEAYTMHSVDANEEGSF